MSLLAWGLVLSLSIVWGGSYLFAEIALQALPPLLIVWLRVGIAALILWGIMAVAKNYSALTWQQWRDLAIMSFLNNVVPFSGIVWAQTLLTGALASIYVASMPIFTVILAILFRAETPRVLRILGAIIGFVGVAILMQGDLSLNQPLWPQALLLLAAFSYGLAALWGRRLAGIHAMQIAYGQVSTSTLWLLIPVALIDRPWDLTLPSGEVIVSILLLASLCTALAYIWYFRILEIAGSVHLSLVTFIIPPSAIFLGWLVLDETLFYHHFLGMGVIFVGLWLINHKNT
ncbi:MAG: DMT family transporter [Pseudomonadota bacterium]